MCTRCQRESCFCDVCPQPTHHLCVLPPPNSVDASSALYKWAVLSQQTHRSPSLRFVRLRETQTHGYLRPVPKWESLKAALWAISLIVCFFERPTRVSLVLCDFFVHPHLHP
eukprot:RCo053553